MDIAAHLLEDGRQRLRILSLGAITADWRVALPGGGAVPVILGHDDPAAYLGDDRYTGAIVGRVSGRIRGARFSLAGRDWRLNRNQGRHHLHGGPGGPSRRNWDMQGDGARAVRLTCRLEHGDDGYPGALDVQVDIRLDGGRLIYDMLATPDRPTPVSLAQHNYYNLAGGGLIWGHRLRVAARSFTETDAELIPTGAVKPLPPEIDFSCGRTLEQRQHGALDVNVVIPEGHDRDWPVAVLSAPGGLSLRMWSDQPGLQLYTGANLPVPGAGLCLEPQNWPDAVNHPAFPSPVVTPERPYRQRLVLEITPEGGP